MSYYVYTYAEPNGGVVFYVGKGKGRRAWEHLKRKDKCHFTNKLRQMLREGVVPEVVTYECATEAEALATETFLIEEIGTVKVLPGIKRGPLTNLTPGGGQPPNVKGIVRSQATKEKIGAANKGKLSGRKQSAEHIAKKIAATKGGTKSATWHEAVKRTWEQKRVDGTAFGRVPSNKNKLMSEEQKTKLKEAWTRRKQKAGL